jgi:hypothetical protein
MLGDFNLFSWKSKEQQRQEDEKYAQWAFPYGEEQRRRLVRLMQEIFPRADEPAVLIPFLTCKELFGRMCKSPAQVDYAVGKLLNDVKKYKQILKKKDMPIFVALVVADSQVDEKLEYPSADEILAMAKGFAVTKGDGEDK